MEPILRMRGIVKHFPGVKANDGVDLTIYPGEIHALVGENGAGKSTLMSILYGHYTPDAGTIELRGEVTRLSGPAEAISRGIGMVFQHFMLVPPLTVAENVVLGREPKKGLLFDKARAVSEVEKLSSRFGLKVEANARVESISVGMQQRVEILKTLYRGAEILILDEPTAVLTPQEVDELFATLKELVKQGKTIIFITHKLREVMHMSDRVTVMRAGKLVGEVLTKETNEKEIARMMVGRDVLLQVEKTPAKPAESVLEVSQLSCRNNRNLPALQSLSLNVRRGEILGIAGVEGNGQAELLEVLTGLRRATAGSVRLKGEDITHARPDELKDRKVAHIPDDRHKRGLVLPWSISENLLMGYHRRQPWSRFGILNQKAIDAHASALIPKFDIRTPGAGTAARSLSGGNQQKIVIAREFTLDPDLLIVSQPTRGVDVGAIEFIHRQIISMRDQGKAILLISAELSEVMSLSDRIAVMYEGEIVAETSAATATEAQLGLWMAGVRDENASGGGAHA